MCLDLILVLKNTKWRDKLEAVDRLVEYVAINLTLSSDSCLPLLLIILPVLNNPSLSTST